ncbi:hypothetical protein [Streptomyces nanshensis]|uniref:Uncharacterized protein n=1 Tax=Streptomyces nanshensis TaxID=518642 RepID=A0A1E7L8R8_9ACTN|nr:hypothetical protein [Streptomyces nanshensis]OEV12589.1 hypothetical protein AN218_07650 [Streptomyces nanshensis]
MIPQVWQMLRKRIATDRRSSENRELAVGHYMDVVFLDAPLDAGKLIKMYQDLSTRLMGRLGSGEKTTLRLSPGAAERAADIKELLDEADYSRKGLYVVSALAVRYLAELDEAGPLPQPELPSLF